MNNMRIRNLNHSTYKHLYHIVWGTKFRRKYLKEYVKKELIKSFKETEEKYPTLCIEAINVDEDHVHIQIEIPPNISVLTAVQKIKSNSSKQLRKKFKFIREIYLDDDWIWSVGYFSSTVWLNEKLIKAYIEHQWKKDYPEDQVSFEFS